MHRSERAAANDYCATLREPFLSFFTDAGEENLAGISLGIHLRIADCGLRIADLGRNAEFDFNPQSAIRNPQSLTGRLDQNFSPAFKLHFVAALDVGRACASRRADCRANGRAFAAASDPADNRANGRAATRADSSRFAFELGRASCRERVELW